ncbi:nitroreductase family protein [Pseudorhodoferax sp. Leaf265]|uniref:nitroreductase family protein n=1 Tax=Pseudorhodoferax sp. Leaf265 TaxID=1736315 RepID=UPI0006F40556|nr:nitroreductase family protein [Pseudorhodoferax sp. Leaf265]
MYYLLFNSSFTREQHATLVGRWQHIRHVASSAVAAVVVRRNVHRLEKGLCMVPARERFALDYIDETLTAFGDLLKSPQDFELPLIRYAHDVLTAYFAATKWPASAPQPERFRTLRLRVPPQVHSSAAAVPLPQRSLPPMDVSYSQFLRLTQRRASVRNFQAADVPRAAVEQAIAAAAQAPSACNRQPLRYIAVADNATKLKLARLPMGTAGYAEGIPLMLAVVGDLSAYPFERDRHIIYIDASLANMQFMLALETLGLASCSINWPDMEQRERKAAALLMLKPYERIVMLMAVGYPDPAGLVPHSEKKSVEEMLTWM